MSSYVQVPVRIKKPKLAKGRFHKLTIDLQETRIDSWAGMFGNVVAETLLRIPHKQVISVAYHRSMTGGYFCTLQYISETGQTGSLQMAVIAGDDFQPHRDLTLQVVETIDALRKGINVLPGNPIIYSLRPATSIQKFIYGFLLLALALITGGIALNLGIMLFLGGALLFLNAIALAIDYVRLNTGWNPLSKLLTYVLCIILGVTLFITTLFLI